jgi:AcrR family transcriptional regulator
MTERGSNDKADPLFETLFRGSSSAVAIASAAPIPTIGTHSRAGNAMGRTRAALLVGAAKAVVATGTKITMSQVASFSGVAKATLYNHFRTRDAVLAALLAHEVDEVLNRATSASLERALVDAATEISTHPILRSLAQTEPATLAALARVDVRIEAWRRVYEAVAVALRREGLGGEGVVVRWLASYLMTPATEESITADVAIVMAGLPVRPSETDAGAPSIASAATIASTRTDPMGALFGPASPESRSA